MKTINLNLSDEKSIFTTLKNDIGGELKNFSQETEFKVDREFGKGTIRGIELENGITFLEFDLVCNEDLSIVVENKVRSNVNFVYCTKGMLQHSFGNSDKTYKIEAFQTSILSNIESTSNTLYFKKDVNIQSTRGTR